MSFSAANTRSTRLIDTLTLALTTAKRTNAQDRSGALASLSTLFHPSTFLDLIIQRIGVGIAHSVEPELPVGRPVRCFHVFPGENQRDF